MSTKIVVFDKQGNKHLHNHPIDAKEAIASGNFFATNPLAPPKPKEIVAEPEIAAGEDIQVIKKTAGEDIQVGNKLSGDIETEKKDDPPARRKRQA